MSVNQKISQFRYQCITTTDEAICRELFLRIWQQIFSSLMGQNAHRSLKFPRQIFPIIYLIILVIILENGSSAWLVY